MFLIPEQLAGVPDVSMYDPRWGSLESGFEPLTFVPSGVKVITAPVNLCVWFKPPLALPRRVAIEFWEASDHVGFRVHHRGGEVSHLTGLVSRSWKSANATEACRGI